ncbi:hypothetical protein [Gordoniibacillus kamchatkensis]|uniref:hypothetical protein n=1 Tax=Gordoniibacillus kamchatkensis TaxID=1590651 RepID=UPI000696EEFC|nr:hypothetical protein [Paenibacillus sp. VKM B-2647]
MRDSGFELEVRQPFRFEQCLEYMTRSPLECLYEVREGRVIRLVKIPTTAADEAAPSGIATEGGGPLGGAGIGGAVVSGGALGRAATDGVRASGAASGGGPSGEAASVGAQAGGIAAGWTQSDGGTLNEAAAGCGTLGKTARDGVQSSGDALGGGPSGKAAKDETSPIIGADGSAAGRSILLELSCPDDRVLRVRFLQGEPQNEHELAAIQRYIREWFDLDRDLEPWHRLASGDPVLGELAERFTGCGSSASRTCSRRSAGRSSASR